MARKKNDNTFLWVAAIGVGGYLLWKHKSSSAVPVTTVADTTPVATTTNQPVLSLPASSVLNINPNTSVNSNSGYSGSASTNDPANGPVNLTGLVPVQNNNGQMIIPPGTAIAVNSTGQAITNSQGQLQTFAPATAYLDTNHELETALKTQQQLVQKTMAGVGYGEIL